MIGRHSKSCFYRPLRSFFSASSSSSPSPLRHSCYDIIVVGGGMVGGALASAIGSSPLLRSLRVALLEPSPPDYHSPLPAIPSLRVSAITPLSASFLKNKAGLDWGSMRKGRYDEMHVWSTATNNGGRVHWTADRIYGDTKFEGDDRVLGYIVENDLIQQQLFRKLAELSSMKGSELEVAAPSKVEGLTREGAEELGGGRGWPVLTLNNGQKITSRLLIGCDGANSLVKRFAGVQSFGWDYNQKAVVATIRTEQAHTTAFQRFLPNGPIACLPCHDNYSNIVWSTSHSHAKHLCSISPQQFIDDVNAAFNAPAEQFTSGPSLIDQFLPSNIKSLIPILLPPPRLSVPPPVVEVCGPRMFFPLRFIHNTSYVTDNVALIGDAGHVIHPMAGQGVNLGLGDGEELVEALEKAIQSGSNIGAAQNLRNWERSRYAQNSLIMHSVDVIQKMFAVNNGPFVWLRTLGMDLFNINAAIKNRAAVTAMGIDPLKGKEISFESNHGASSSTVSAPR